MAVSWLVFHLTDRCQLDCRHCLRDPGRAPRDLPLPVLEKVLDEAQRVYRTDHVGLTGGEPTLHPRFAEVLDAIVSRGLTWHVVTNALTFPRLVELLEEQPRRRELLTALDFSLEGADEGSHDAIRGEGSFRTVMAAIAHAAALGLPLALQMTVNALNLGQLEPMGLLASQLGASRLSIGMTQPTGTPRDAELRLGRHELRGVHDRVLRLGEHLRLPVTANEGFGRAQPFHACEPFRSELLHVDPRGRLTLCCALSGIPGEEGAEILADLADTSLVEAHRRMLGLIDRFQREKLEAMERSGLEGWDLFPCNYCQKVFGKPHWTDDGAAGPRAERPRRLGAGGEGE